MDRFDRLMDRIVPVWIIALGAYIVAVGLVLLSSLAHAESWTVTGPGGVTYVDRNPVDLGGLLVRPPGEPMAIVTPNGVGTGYMVIQPGRPTRYINRSGE